ncbi:hypothetical protein WAI453_006061 [Rhynchosporium graminicola]
MLVFPAKNQKSIPFLDTSVFSDIQQVVRHTAISGMILQEETENSDPSGKPGFMSHRNGELCSRSIFYTGHTLYTIMSHLSIATSLPTCQLRHRSIYGWLPQKKNGGIYMAGG